jgi:hypothetical protein
MVPPVASTAIRGNEVCEEFMAAIVAERRLAGL